MNKLIFPFVVLLMATIAFSCKKTGNAPLLKNASGNAGELVIVISPELLETSAGEEIKKIFSEPQLGLPQDEPLFDVITIPQEAFGDIFKTTRNLIITKILPSEQEPKVSFQRDVHSNTQAVVVISAKNSADMSEAIKAKADKMKDFFLKAERERIITNYTNFNEKSISKTTEELFGFTLSIPPGYKVAEAKDTFAWIRYETAEISQGILIYTFPYVSDSTFTKNYLLAKRNIVLKNNVPGPTEGSYMTTETELSPLFLKMLTFNGNFAAELRGLWTVENDFMGGPFVSLYVLDLLKKRVIALDGYVYAPSKDKRNYIRQVEGIINSAKFTNQADMDKINKQFAE